MVVSTVFARFRPLTITRDQRGHWIRSTVWFRWYLTRALIWQLCQFSIRPSIYLVRLWNHVRICSWHRPELSNKGKVSCSRTQRGPLMGLEPTTSTLRVRRATHCTRPPLYELWVVTCAHGNYDTYTVFFLSIRFLRTHDAIN